MVQPVNSQEQAYDDLSALSPKKELKPYYSRGSITAHAATGISFFSVVILKGCAQHHVLCVLSGSCSQDLVKEYPGSQS